MSLKLSHMQAQLIDLGVIDYKEAYAFQKNHVDQCLLTGEQSLIFCEHPNTLTLGRMTQKTSLLFTHEELKEKGFGVYPVDRGGDVTLHAPGQLVVYPILNLQYYVKDLKWYLSKLEEVAIDLLGDFDIVASRNLRNTGVWIDQKKIVSLGIGVRKWVTYHGMGINVNTDLNLFKVIKPCGLDVHMTSIKELEGRTVDMNDVKARVAQYFKKHFSLNF